MQHMPKIDPATVTPVRQLADGVMRESERVKAAVRAGNVGQMRVALAKVQANIQKAVIDGTSAELAAELNARGYGQ